VKPALERLFHRRLLVIAGKGGVGKTTIACALGLAGARLGKRTLIAEVDGAGRAAFLLGTQPGPIGEAREARSSLSVMSVEGSVALAEYLQIILPVKRVLQAVFSSRIYQYFVAAAPGLKELMTIGKIWYEAERVEESSGRPLWDLVIVDAPATGHSLQYLRMPQAAHEAFGGGLVGRESQRLLDLLRDPKRTAINLVTTAEEMPVNETADMYRQIAVELRMPLGVLFVNRTHRTSFESALFKRLEQGAARLRDTQQRAFAEEALQRAREESGWTNINATYLQRLAAEIDMPSVEVPFLFSEEFGVQQVQMIATEMESEGATVVRRSRSHGRA
jgi:anion-transporting  ArsA/GET3 family ATPase